MKIILLSLVLVLFLVGCVEQLQGFDSTGKGGIVTEPRTYEPVVSVELTVQELEKIDESKQKISDSGGHDFSGLYELLEANAGRKEKLLKISEEFHPLVALKKVSSDNPQFREEVCMLLEKKLREDFANQMTPEELNKFVKDHVSDCTNGIQQIIR